MPINLNNDINPFVGIGAFLGGRANAKRLNAQAQMVFAQQQSRVFQQSFSQASKQMAEFALQGRKANIDRKARVQASQLAISTANTQDLNRSAVQRGFKNFSALEQAAESKNMVPSDFIGLLDQQAQIRQQDAAGMTNAISPTQQLKVDAIDAETEAMTTAFNSPGNTLSNQDFQSTLVRQRRRRDAITSMKRLRKKQPQNAQDVIQNSIGFIPDKNNPGQFLAFSTNPNVKSVSTRGSGSGNADPGLAALTPKQQEVEIKGRALGRKVEANGDVKLWDKGKWVDKVDPDKITARVLTATGFGEKDVNGVIKPFNQEKFDKVYDSIARTMGARVDVQQTLKDQGVVELKTKANELRTMANNPDASPRIRASSGALLSAADQMDTAAERLSSSVPQSEANKTPQLNARKQELQKMADQVTASRQAMDQKAKNNPRFQKMAAELASQEDKLRREIQNVDSDIKAASQNAPPAGNVQQQQATRQSAPPPRTTGARSTLTDEQVLDINKRRNSGRGVSIGELRQLDAWLKDHGQRGIFN